MTRKQEDGWQPDPQHGTTATFPQYPHGGEKQKDGSKPPKTPKTDGKDLEVTPAIFHIEEKGELSTQGPSTAIMPQITDTEEDEAAQPTLADILSAVHKCTASIDTMKENS